MLPSRRKDIPSAERRYHHHHHHLSTIFLLALDTELSSPSHEENWQHGENPLVRLPLVVSHVSKQWRTCALQTPELWRVVQCGFVRRDREEEKRWVKNELTRLWMERAREGAIELWVVTGPVQRYEQVQVKPKKRAESGREGRFE